MLMKARVSKQQKININLSWLILCLCAYSTQNYGFTGTWYLLLAPLMCMEVPGLPGSAILWPVSKVTMTN